MAIIKIGNPAIDLDAAEIPNLDTAKITTGTLADARVPDLNASKITAGTITDARLPANALNSNVSVPNQSAFKNIIINGDMSIAQRGTSTSSVTGDGYYTVDRFNLDLNTLGTWTQSQSTDVPTGQGFATSLKMDCTTANASPSANDKLVIEQSIEGQNLQYLKKGTSSAESLTLSFWVKTNKTGTYTLELLDNDNSRSFSQTYTVSSADTWEKKTLTYAGDTSGAFGNDNGSSLQCNFYLGAGSSFTSGTFQDSWGSKVKANRVSSSQVNLADSTSNEWYVTGVQLEAGTAASDFEFLPVDVNTTRCYRYYQKSYSYNVVVGTNTTNGLHTTDGSAGGLTTGSLYGQIDLKETMRASPTVTAFDKAGNSGKCARLNSGVSRTDNQNISIQDIIEKSFTIISEGTANAGAIDVHYQAVSEL